MKDKKQCYFCANNIRIIDYKNVEPLKRFLSMQAKILPKNQTGLCAKHQRKLSRTIKRARIMSLLPFVAR
ncbi:MAG: 30S ribosomal protein S18 [Candidatus Tagabacteria bacterium RIFCSPLOWO2_01_FULL_39_11]|uniref:Small ribosomal subunit protein bS18 n=1 Tax=Candidatus Tagabacteria bacterium RIFCSPLOWO2_01_FULL_39_11 TaxID=1802295 RepID=A0A1G2LRH1_9BACT|nr:MAG: 30S ribosomal protein S18 [Candidatus Tagabacteria bacterium RIFCSPLOWO2_01_FULL_39_11]